MSNEKTIRCRRVIRKRNRHEGDALRTHKLQVRMTDRVSAETASIQGLCCAFGKRETIAELWERVALPALREYVKGYADKAREARRSHGIATA